MLNFIYYPVSAILWFWHKAFGYLLGPGNGFGWALAVVFLVFTLRAVLFKPFVSQVRSMRKMQEFAPEIQKLKKKYGDDKQKMAAEMQKLQSEHGVNPLGGCLPVLVQIPVFIGLFHVLRSFNRPSLSPEMNRQTANYVFSALDVQSFLDARVFGVPLSAFITEPTELLARYGDISRWQIAVVAVPLTIVAGVLTHLTAKQSVARQNPAQIAANPQAAMMNKLMVWLFPLGVVGGGPFFPLAILMYWLSNNLWTLGQQRVVYQRIEAEDAEKKEVAIAQRQALGPRPGQKPIRSKRDAAGNPTAAVDEDAAAGMDRRESGSAAATSNGAVSNGVAPTQPGASEGPSGAQSSPRADGSAPPGMIQQRPRPRKKTNRKRR
ncbi:MAG: membrane protein insertase YidC [Actinomycetota bacterium]|nr:membrane protein insertase YidC [Actinomycetota bacterium]